MKKRKAIALYSGGLDSTLAVKLVEVQGIEVLAVYFRTGFSIADVRKRRGKRSKEGSEYENPAVKYARKYGFPLKVVDVSYEYFDVITNPRYGYGSYINPCIDCRIFMFRKAREMMESVGADFLVSGEVLKQRPMTQHLQTLQLIDRRAEVQGLVLRPLSAKALEPTIPEIEGWVDREKLEGIVGRNRTRQMELAREFGIDEFEPPGGGGCYLADESFARKYREVLAVEGEMTRDHLFLLTLGRHFRLPTGIKVVVSRNAGETAALEALKSSYWFFDTVGQGPVAVVRTADARPPTNEEIQTTADILAGYSKTTDGTIEVVYRSPDGRASGSVIGRALKEELLSQWRVA
jgi:tRNA U34 2-thiouridine synthase MnmA/TrmU